MENRITLSSIFTFIKDRYERYSKEYQSGFLLTIIFVLLISFFRTLSLILSFLGAFAPFLKFAIFCLVFLYSPLCSLLLLIMYIDDQS